MTAGALPGLPPLTVDMVGAAVIFCADCGGGGGCDRGCAGLLSGPFARPTVPPVRGALAAAGWRACCPPVPLFAFPFAICWRAGAAGGGVAAEPLVAAADGRLEGAALAALPMALGAAVLLPSEPVLFFAFALPMNKPLRLLRLSDL